MSYSAFEVSEPQARVDRSESAPSSVSTPQNYPADSHVTESKTTTNSESNTSEVRMRSFTWVLCAH